MDERCQAARRIEDSDGLCDPYWPCDQPAAFVVVENGLLLCANCATRWPLPVAPLAGAP